MNSIRRAQAHPISATGYYRGRDRGSLGILKSSHLVLGPRLKEFEGAIAEYAGVRYAVAVNSGTSALHLIIRALGIGEGDEVITTPFSFISSSNCILYERARPVFVDIDPKTLNIDPERIEAAITSRTKAILAVDMFSCYPPCFSSLLVYNDYAMCVT